MRTEEILEILESVPLESKDQESSPKVLKPIELLKGSQHFKTPGSSLFTSTKRNVHDIPFIQKTQNGYSYQLFFIPK